VQASVPVTACCQVRIYLSAADAVQEWTREGLRVRVLWLFRITQ